MYTVCGMGVMEWVNVCVHCMWYGSHDMGDCVDTGCGMGVMAWVTVWTLDVVWESWSG